MAGTATSSGRNRGRPGYPVPDRIRHIDDLQPDEVLEVTKALRAGTAEISEKVDGSARIEIGFPEGGFVPVRTKHSPWREHPGAHKFEAVKQAHKLLEKYAQVLRVNWPVARDQTIFAEVLYGKIPNSIPYGPNAIVVHGGASTPVLREFAANVGDCDGWLFRAKPTYKIKFDIREDVLNWKKKTHVNELKKILLKKVSSHFGGGMVEGLVITTESGIVTKVVDRQYFTELNKFYWNYRERLDRGIKVENMWKPGIMARVYESFATKVAGDPTFRSPSLVKKIAEAAPGAKSIDEMLRRYIESKNIFNGDSVTTMLSVLESASADALALQVEWGTAGRLARMTLISEIHGKKDVTIPEEVAAKTDAAFQEHRATLKRLLEGARRLKECADPMDQKVGLLRMMMSENRLRALREAIVGASTKVNSSTWDMAGFTDVLNKAQEKLAKRGYQIQNYIGHGSAGAAFALKSGKVLKITIDDREARASFHLKGKNLQHVVHIYDVFAFTKERYVEIYGIVMDKLDNLSPKERSDIEKFEDLIWEVLPQWDGTWEEIAEFYGANQNNKKLRQIVEIAKKYELNAMLLELNRHGIKWSDLHAGNVMKKGNRLLAIDLGFSQAPPGDPPVLERKELPSAAPQEFKIDAPDVPIYVEWPAGAVRKGVSPDGKEWCRPMNAHYGFVEGTTSEDGEGVDVYVNPAASYRPKMLARRSAVVICQLKKDGTKDEDKVMLGFNGSDEAEKMYRSHMPNNGDGFYGGKFELSWEEFVNSYLAKYSNKKIRREAIREKIETHRSRGSLVIENLVVEMTKKILAENKADMVGVTIGRFQPPHKGHTETIRKLAQKFNKVLVFVAGNNQNDQKNPFPLQQRIQILKKSLADCESKIEFIPAEFNGKPTGFIPHLLQAAVDLGFMKSDTAVNVMVGKDRFAEFKKQFEKAEGMGFPENAVVGVTPAVMNDDDAERVSGTQVRKLIASGDKEAVKKLMDPLLVSNEADFDEAFEDMRHTMTGEKIRENFIFQEGLIDSGGEPAIQEVLKVNAEKLAARKPFPVDVQNLHRLGNGEDGIAYDMGGDKVFKVTTDLNEAASSYKILGKKLKHIVHIHDVFKFKETGSSRGSFYGIVLEKLTPMSYEDQLQFQPLQKLLRNPEVYVEFRKHNIYSLFDAIRGVVAKSYGLTHESKKVREASGGEQFKKAARDVQTGAGGPKAKGKTSAERRADTTKKAYEEVQRTLLFVAKMFEKYQMKGMLKDLKSVGIVFYDFHIGNIMKRGSDYVITDLGRSDGGKAPPVLEKVVESLIEDFTSPVGSASPNPGISRAGSSGWSSGNMSKIDKDEEGEWQTQLYRHLQPITHGFADNTSQKGDDDGIQRGPSDIGQDERGRASGRQRRRRS